MSFQAKELSIRGRNYFLRKFRRPTVLPSEDPIYIVVAMWNVFLCCCTNLPIYVYPVTQSLNSICSSQPTGQERISCHEISCNICDWLV